MTLYTWLSIYKKIYAPILLAVFSIVLLTGINLENIQSQTSAEANPCMFDSSQDCLYGFSEHILEWQSTFYTSMKDTTIYILFALLVGTVYFAFIPTDTRNILWLSGIRKLFLYRLRIRTFPLKLYTYIQLLFSNGILHPKLF